MKRPPILHLPFAFAFVLAVSSISLLSSASGVTITADNVGGGVPNAVVVTSTNTLMSVGMGTIGIGYFSLDGGVTQATDAQVSGLSSAAALDAAFYDLRARPGGVDGADQKSTINIVAGVYTVPFSANIIAGGENTDFAVAPKNVYTFIGDQLSYAASTEFLVFKHASTFPTNPAAGFFAILDAAAWTANPANLLWGSFGAPAVTVPVFNTTAFPFRLEAIPEPSRAVFAALGLLGVLLRRRR